MTAGSDSRPRNSRGGLVSRFDPLRDARAREKAEKPSHADGGSEQPIDPTEALLTPKPVKKAPRGRKVAPKPENEPEKAPQTPYEATLAWGRAHDVTDDPRFSVVCLLASEMTTSSGSVAAMAKEWRALMTELLTAYPPETDPADVDPTDAVIARTLSAVPDRRTS